MTEDMVAIIGGLMVPIVLFIVGLVIVIFVINYKLKKNRMIQEAVKAAIERGASGEEIKAISEAMGEGAKGSRTKNSLLGGITVLAWGLGLGVFFLINVKWGLAALLGIPLSIIGIAKIVWWALGGSKKEAAS